MITTPAGCALAQQARELFAALVELDKHVPHEVNEIIQAQITSIRSFRPQALLAAQVEAVTRG